MLYASEGDGFLLLQECWWPVLGQGAGCLWTLLFNIPDSSSLLHSVCQQLCQHAWSQAGMGLNAAGGSSLNGNKLYLYEKAVSCCQITGSIFFVCLRFAKWWVRTWTERLLRIKFLNAFWPHIERERKNYLLRNFIWNLENCLPKHKWNEHSMSQSLGNVAFHFILEAAGYCWMVTRQRMAVEGVTIPQSHLPSSDLKAIFKNKWKGNAVCVNSEIT